MDEEDYEMAGVDRNTGERNVHFGGGHAEDDLHADWKRTNEMLLRPAERWKAALHPDEEDNRQMLLQRNVTANLQLWPNRKRNRC